MIGRIIKKAPILFFYLFLLSIPLQARLVFFPAVSFNEYKSYFLYISDILLIITLISWFVKRLYFQAENVSRETSHKKSPFIICYLLFVIFLAWSFLSLLWTQNIGVGLFRAVKLTEFAFLFLFVLFNIRTQKRLFWTILCITITGFFQAIIGIWQYFIQHSIGLKWLGETILSPDMPGVAKIMVGGEKVMRAYGTFPHPNVFAGFLLLSITCGLLLLFREKRIWTQVFFSFLVSLQTVAFILTFSRVAWIGGVCLFVYLFICLFRRKLLVKSLKLAVLAITLIILISGAVFWPQIAGRFSLEGQALEERGLYNNIALSMIKKSPLLGVGMGNFVARIDDFSHLELENWQYQPVHNIYLLILAELGIIGLVLFIFLIFNVLKGAWFSQKSLDVSRETSNSLVIGHWLLVIFLGFLFIGFFDHYFWTLQQGGLIFWLVLGILGGLLNVSRETL